VQPATDPRPPRTIGAALALARSCYPSTANPHVTLAAIHALLAHVTHHNRAWLLAYPEAPLDPAQAEAFSALLDRLARGEPLAYLTGSREFYGLRFSVTPAVLVPRPETEDLVHHVLAWAADHPRPTLHIADVGTGSGAIAVTLAVKVPHSRVTALDISAAALKVARRNAQTHAVHDRITLLQTDLLSALRGPFDVIAANLPYISAAELPALDVYRWEPQLALDGGQDGLDLIRRLLEQAPTRLAPGGLLILEIGHDQGQAVTTLCRRAFPSASIRVHPDLSGIDRLVSVQTP
jgi:release factor glutamine methyltransferase